MNPFQRLAIGLVAAALPATAFAQVAATTDIKVPAVAGEIAMEQLVQTGDDKLSCEVLRSEIRTLVEVVKKKDEAAEKVQVASLDKAATERLAAANRARADTQDQTNKAQVEAKTKIEPLNVKFDPANPVKPAEPNLAGIETLKAEFKGGAPTISPTQMRQYRLTHIAYEKGC